MMPSDDFRRGRSRSPDPESSDTAARGLSGGPSATSTVPGFSGELPYRLSDQVALRTEHFGGLAYHYGNRRLNFLNSDDLVRVLRCLGEHPSARAAFDHCGIDERRWSSFESALQSLAESGFLEPQTLVQATAFGVVESRAAGPAVTASEFAGSQVPVQAAASGVVESRVAGPAGVMP